MSFFTYSQNFEDVLLWRALKSVESGFYIDIGAQDPVLDSVSRGFYEQNWRGIHVEPTRQYSEMLRRDRPDETVIQAAVSDRPGMLKFFEIPDTGLSTASETIAESHRNSGWTVLESIVPALTLDALFDACPKQEIHWIKIDVEGLELPVLRGWTRDDIRPWIVVMEAVYPMQRSGSEHEWEHLLLAKGYQFAYFDGLNRYYVSADHLDLLEHFSYGPCLWDEFQIPEIARPARWLMEEQARKLAAIEAESANSIAAKTEEYAAKIIELNEAVATLSDARIEIEVLRRTRERLDLDLNFVHQELNSARKAVAEAEVGRDAARSELTRLSEQFEADSQQLKAWAESEVGHVRAESDANSAFWRTQLEALRSELSSAHQNELLRVRDAAAVQLNSLQSDLDQVRGRLENASRYNLLLADEISQLRNDLDFAHQELARVRAELISAQQSLSACDIASQEAAAELAGVRDQFAASQRSWSRQRLRLAAELESVTESLWWKLSAPFRRRTTRLSLVAAEAEFGQELSTPSAAFASLTLNQLLNYNGCDFVKSAYLTLLGREPKADEIEHYLAVLQLCPRKDIIVAAISNSDEGRAFGAVLPGLTALKRQVRLFQHPVLGRLLRSLGRRPRTIRPFETLPSPIPPYSLQGHVAASLDELLGMRDADFISSAYATILGRNPDSDGFAHHLERLRLGEDPLVMLATMRWSAEGAPRKPNLPGLERSTLWYRYRNIPLISLLLRLISSPSDRTPVGLRLAKVQAELVRLKRAIETAKVEVRSDEPASPVQPDAPPTPPQSSSIVVIDSHSTDDVAPPERIPPPSHVVSGGQAILSLPPKRSIGLWTVGASARDVASATLEHALNTNFTPTSASSIASTLVFGPPPYTESGQMERLVVADLDWAESEIPFPWVEYFNERVNAIGTASSLTAKLLTDHGITTPILPVGTDLGAWTTLTAAHDFHLKARSFRFLTTADHGELQTLRCTLKSFARAFDGRDPVSLVIYAGPCATREIQSITATELAHLASPPDVLVVPGPLNDQQLKSLYHACHTYIGVAAGSGVSVATAKAALCGLPIITSGFGGQRDYCTPGSAFLVDYQFTPSATSASLPGSTWASPEPGALDEALLAALRASPDERSKMGKAAQLAALPVTDTAEIAARLSHLIGLPRAERRNGSSFLHLGILTTWNVKCGIATHSNELFGELPADNVTWLAAHQLPLINPERANAVRCWAPGKEANGLSEVVQAVKARQIDVVVIQFNYGFFNHSELNGFVEEMSKIGVPVMMILHSTLDPDSTSPNSSLRGLLPALHNCDRVIAHTLLDLNRLKRLGVIDNAMLLSHGIAHPKLRAINKTDNSRPLIASFGFCFENKGLIELVRATSLLRKSGLELRLLMLNAIHPAPESGQMADRIRKEIVDLGLSDSVEFVTDFLDIEDCVDRLSNADLFVNPYQRTGESASGSVRLGLRAGCPTAVTPLPIFDDLGEAVFRLPGLSEAEIADGIAATLAALRCNTDEAQSVARSAKVWIERHDYAHQAQRLLRLGQALVQQRHWKKQLNGELL